MVNADFSVSGFKQRTRRKVKDKNQAFYVETVKNKIMETTQQFKNSPEIREYWKIHKRLQRAKAKPETNEK